MVEITWLRRPEMLRVAASELALGVNCRLEAGSSQNQSISFRKNLTQLANPDRTTLRGNLLIMSCAPSGAPISLVE